MSRGKIFFFLLLSFLFQFSFFPFLFDFVGLNILLLWVIVVAFSQQVSFSEKFLWILLGGIILDIFSVGSFVGVGVFSFLVVGFLVEIFKKFFPLSEKFFLGFSLLFFLVKIFFDFIFVEIFNVISFFSKNSEIGIFDFSSQRYLLEMVLFILVGYGVMNILLKFEKKRKNEIRID